MIYVHIHCEGETLKQYFFNGTAQDLYDVLEEIGCSEDAVALEEEEDDEEWDEEEELDYYEEDEE